MVTFASIDMREVPQMRSPQLGGALQSIEIVHVLERPAGYDAHSSTAACAKQPIGAGARCSPVESTP